MMHLDSIQRMTQLVIKVQMKEYIYKGAKDAQYLYFELDEEDQSLNETSVDDIQKFRDKYLNEIQRNQDGLVSVRVLMNMTKKEEIFW